MFGTLLNRQKTHSKRGGVVVIVKTSDYRRLSSPQFVPTMRRLLEHIQRSRYCSFTAPANRPLCGSGPWLCTGCVGSVLTHDGERLGLSEDGGARDGRAGRLAGDPAAADAVRDAAAADIASCTAGGGGRAVLLAPVTEAAGRTAIRAVHRMENTLWTQAAL